jgi:hypothetical protein
MKQETIREVVKRYYEDNIDESNIPREHYEWEIQDLMIGFAHQWQQEQDKNKYSEEDLEKAFKVGFTLGYGSDVEGIDDKDECFNRWFKIFKDK